MACGMLISATNALLRAVLAPTCAACDRALDAPLNGSVCATCWRAVELITPPLCEQCGDQIPDSGAGPRCERCERGDTAFDCAASVGVYDGSLREMVHALKYRRRRMIAPPLAARMRRAGARVLAGADAVVPVPLHPWRSWQRGFNQADDLARGLGLPVWRVLRRSRGGPPQASLPASQRHANAHGAYGIGWTEVVRARRRDRLRGATIVLVDDVLTTGATLNACALVLRRAGVRRVRVITAARAVAGRPTPLRPTRHLSTAHR
jgi:ComF family protein